MRLLLIYLFLIYLYSAGAQETTVFAPLGAKWSYNSEYSYPSRFFQFVTEKDTLIMGQNTRLLRCYIFENDQITPVDSLNKYVMTDGDKVFYKVGFDFILLYDFGAIPGDTIHSKVEYFPIFMGCSSDFQNGPIDYSYVIDSLGTVEIDGIILRTQFVTVIEPPDIGPSWYFQEPIVERIGQIGYGGYWWGSGEACIFENNGFLRCYNDTDLSYINSDFAQQHECDYTGTKEIDHIHSQLIYPNPTSDLINLQEKADIIIIYNSIGEKINEFKNLSCIDISELTPNIYFIQFQIKNRLHTEKFIKL